MEGNLISSSVTEYTIVLETALPGFCESVNQKLKEGWDLYKAPGYTTQHDRSFWYQAMVKTEEGQQIPLAEELLGWAVERPTANGVSIRTEWFQFCSDYGVPLRTRRAVGRYLRHNEGWTLTRFLSANPQDWLTIRNIGPKAVEEIKQARDRYLARYSAQFLR